MHGIGGHRAATAIPQSQQWLMLVRLLPSHTSVGYFKRERERFVVMLPLAFQDVVYLFF